MNHPVRWGILSTANIGRAFVRGAGLCTDSCIQAVASREYERAAEWAKENGVPRTFGSYEALLNSGGVDAIYNPLPNSLHAEWTIKALEAGIPVLCEKPLTIHAAQAREVAAVARRTGKLLAEAFMYRFHPIYDAILEKLASGVIGKIISIRSCFTFHLGDRSNIRASGELAGGALMDVGCYCVNFSRRMAGCEPVRAMAFERRTTVDDTLMGALEFPNGIVAQFECSIENFGHSRAEIYGSDGAIIIESPWFPGENEAEFVVCHGDQRETIKTPGANSYHLEAEDFVAAIRGTKPLRWPIEDAIANMAVIDALYASTREGQAVAVTN